MIFIPFAGKFFRQDMTQAQTITSKAKSNLAFALIDLPEEERRHMAEFYAFAARWTISWTNRA